MKQLISTFLVAVALVLVWPAAAQEQSGWGIQADVDGDGVVGPTDIQHVVNGALGLDDTGPESVDRPRRQYIVASPRAALAPNPSLVDVADAACGVIGAVDNFPRPNGRLMVKVGTNVVFRYDRNVEGVWYTGACGLLRSELRVEMRRLPIVEETTDTGTAGQRGQFVNTTGTDPVLDNGEDPVVDGEDPNTVEWTPIGRDGAQAIACGPRAATAQIGVKYQFNEAGDFLVRAVINTAAVPGRELESREWCGAVRKRNAVLIHVRVVPLLDEVTQGRYQWQEERDAESIPNRFGDTLEQATDTTYPLPDVNQ